MATNLIEIKRNESVDEKSNSNNASTNARDVDAVIQEIKQHIDDMDRFHKEFEIKERNVIREYKEKVNSSLVRLGKLINN